MTTRSQAKKQAAQAATATLTGQSAITQSQAHSKKKEKTQAPATPTHTIDPRYTTPAPDPERIPKSVLQAPRKRVATERKLPPPGSSKYAVPEIRALRGQYKLGSQGTILNMEDEGRLLVSQYRGQGGSPSTPSFLQGPGQSELPPTPSLPQEPAQSANTQASTPQSVDNNGSQRKILLGPHGTVLDLVYADEEVLRDARARSIAEDLARK